MRNTAILLSLVCSLAATYVLQAKETKPLTIQVEANSMKHPISPYLVGLHQVYTFTPDKVFEDGKFPQWVKQSGVSTSRYPGGSVVKYWDWENPTGQPFIDSNDPGFDPSLNPPASEWMSLDEFLVFAKTTGITPFFGVNSLAGKLYNKEQTYIEKAARMVRYVKDAGFGGGFWYIGNEEAFKHGGIIDYAKTFSRYAKAMKAVDPDIRIFWNDNNPNRERIQDFLANDGGTSDGLETHGKWPFGGDPKMEPASYAEWLQEVPLRDRKNGNRKSGGRIWRTAADEYRAWAREVGREQLIANNEYGLGKGKNLSGFDRYTTGLLLTEVLMEHFIGNWFATCFWDLTRGTGDGLLDKQNDYRLNPFHHGMDLLADCQGGTFLHTISTSDPGIHGFIAKKEDQIHLYLINKSGNERAIALSLEDQPIREAKTIVMRNSDDGYGSLEEFDLSVSGKQVHIKLPDLSFSEIILR